MIALPMPDHRLLRHFPEASTLAVLDAALAATELGLGEEHPAVEALSKPSSPTRASIPRRPSSPPICCSPESPNCATWCACTPPPFAAPSGPSKSMMTKTLSESAASP